MATLAYSSRFGFYTPTWGPDPSEPNQDLLVSDGWKTFIPYKVWVDTDSIDGGAGTVTIPATGIYYINLQMQAVNPPDFPSIDIHTRLLANGAVTLADGYNGGSTGTDLASSTASFAGCLEAGTEVTFQALALDTDVDHVVGYVSLFRVPAPFAQAKLMSSSTDDFVDWAPVCNQPTWLDAGVASRWTIGETGFYFLTDANLSYPPPIGFVDQYWRDNQIYVNGSYINQESTNAGGSSNVPLSTVLELTAGDYVEIFTAFKSGAPMGETSAEMMMCKIPGTVAGAQAYLSQKIYTVNAFVKIDFASTIFDTDGYWSSGTPSRLTVPSGKEGIYLLWAGYWENANRAINFRMDLNGSSSTFIQGGASGSENYALQNKVSPTTLAIRDLAVGDFIDYSILNGDAASGGGPGNANDIRMGMIRLDDWTYPTQRACPCPSDFLPQIYRWLKR